MQIKVLPKRGTTMHVWDRKKYYPGEVKGVDQELGELLISKRIAEKIEEPKPEKKTIESIPFRRGPGRPRKSFSE